MHLTSESTIFFYLFLATVRPCIGLLYQLESVWLSGQLLHVIWMGHTTEISFANFHWQQF